MQGLMHRDVLQDHLDVKLQRDECIVPGNVSEALITHTPPPPPHTHTHARTHRTHHHHHPNTTQIVYLPCKETSAGNFSSRHLQLETSPGHPWAA